MDDDVVAKYDALASTYSRRYADPGAVARFYVDLVQRWGPEPPANARVLEVSCADGFMTEALARGGYRVTAFDISPKMVATARARIQAAGVEADIEVGDIRMFESDSRWDVILAPMWTFFAYVADPDPVLARLAGALAPGGKLLVDRNPRSHPVREGIDALARAGLTGVEWRPVAVPLTKRLGALGAMGLRVALAMPPVRDRLLRRRLNVVLIGRRPEIPGKE
ncbi:MAG: hypothetical protein QOE83_2029 [Actinomycetota bacterium]|nr:hypothetical protein [Actinomycetota bacterium]